MAKIKQLYKGYMQTQRRLFVERCYAYSEKQAKALFCKRIAKKQGVSDRIVFNWFSDPARYKIEIEVLFKEEPEVTSAYEMKGEGS